MAKVFASLAAIVATSLAIVIAPLLAAPAQADNVVDPTAITGLSPATQTVLSNETFFITFDGLASGDTTTWTGAMWVHSYLTGTSTIFASWCTTDNLLSSSAGAADNNNFAENAVIAVELFPLGTTCVNSSTPPATNPAYSATVTVIPNLSVPTMSLTEGETITNQNFAYALQSPLTDTPWAAGGSAALVSDEYCSQGLISTALPAPAPLPAGVSFEAINSELPGVAPGFTLLGTPAAGTAGTYPVCVSLWDSSTDTCVESGVAVCALAVGTVAYAWTTIEVSPALASTGAPSASGGIWLGITAVAVLVAGVVLVVALRIGRKRGKDSTEH